MKIAFTLLLLGASITLTAQSSLTLTCPIPDTFACVNDIPAPDLSQLVVQTSCGVDFDGNPIDTSSTTGSGGGLCDTASVACYSATISNTTTLDNDELRISIQIEYGDNTGCKHAVSHVAFSLPEGVSATDFNESDTYAGQLGSYHVENTTQNPYHSIKFESNGDGFEPGTTEIFTFTLPAGVEYAETVITVKAATNRDVMTLAVDCTDEPSTPTNNVVNYETRWSYDYFVPGGTGCTGDPILLLRNFSATDACFNSYFCTQEFYIESECIDGNPIACSDSASNNQSRSIITNMKIWQPMEDAYAVVFPGSEEHDGGYYSITKIWQPMGEGFGESIEADQELGRVAPLSEEEYTFTHESISASDSITVEWVGQAITVSSTQSVQQARASVYPNPGTNAFTLELPKAVGQNARVLVFDQIGRQQLILPMEVNQSSILLNAEEWIDGLYRIQVIDDAGSFYNATWMKQ